MDPIVRKVIEAGIRAPSGDNCQPWRFVVSGREIRVYNLPGRDESLYGWGQRSSYLAHGSLLENMELCARALGYACVVSLFPDPEDDDFVATVLLEKSSEVSLDPLYHHIFSRVTNRRQYARHPLTDEQRELFFRIGSEVSGARLVLVEDPEKIQTLARAVSVNERLVFENQYLHSFLFHHINWTRSEDEATKLGFYIKTFELPPPAVGVFRLARRWNVLQFLNRAIRLSRSIAAQNAKIYQTSSAIGAIVVDATDPGSYISAGRLLGRIWLHITREGLSLQPITGIPFLALRVREGATQEFSPEHVGDIERAYRDMGEIFEIGRSHIAISFRLGDGGEPSARSLRLEPDIQVV